MALTQLLKKKLGNEVAEKMTSAIYLKKHLKQQLTLCIILLLQ
ncbi:hypothetical protein PMIT1323_00364 [Prochlorococcus marinus str. MIT 1323]|nr:hypothetical protein PMIT1323_00364 [Prochlorococcus marinus str. MIT 1323]